MIQKDIWKTYITEQNNRFNREHILKARRKRLC